MMSGSSTRVVQIGTSLLTKVVIMVFKNLFVGAAIMVAAPFVNGGHMAAQTAPLAVDTPMVHDPVMAYEDGKYYLYCTGHGITQMTSADRRHWTIKNGGVLANGDIPSWTRDSVPGFDTHIWAPDVINYRGTWYMAYSCSTFGKNTSAIGLLSNTSLGRADGWKDEGCIVASKEGRDNWNAIDPNFIVDEKGNPWMTWGSFWDGIQLVRLDRTMHVKRGCKPVTIARRHVAGEESAEPNPTSQFAGTNAIEAPFVMRHGKYYYLFVSWDYCCRGMKSNYRVAVGRSKKVGGPYLDKDGKDMRLGGGTVVMEGDKKQFEAAGHCSAYSFADGDWFFCHGYSMEKNGAPLLIQKRIKWTADGWLTLE